MATPLASNEKLMKDDGGRKVDRTLYRSIVGSLMYLTATRPDIMFASSLLSRYMQDPSEVHLGAAKRVLRYIKGTVAYGIKYFKGEELKLIGFCDSDWAGAFSWQSKKQYSVAQSSVEAKYVAVAVATSQAIWLRRILEDIDERQRNAT
ncbi:secreted RxLR effector protein 161-like [Apium graveolens]|uniref:secreted RxLR effector protein 161-like n=1 Tax=Apium graveolens TaxID=4045 RepID=UPI003D7BDEC7